MSQAGAGTLSLRIEADGVAWLLFDNPGSAANVLNEAVLAELDGWLAKIEGAVEERLIRAVILRSAKDSWLAGHDLSELHGVRNADDARARTLHAQAVLGRLEALSVPTIAAINGACLGSGAELALACAYRLASDTPRTRIGLPETRMGLLPGLGATVRLPRLIGLQSALELILTGRSVDARAARRLGLVDRVATPAQLEAEALRFARRRMRRGWARRAPRRGVAARLLEETAAGRDYIVSRALRRMAEGRGGTPAARRALEVVVGGVGLPPAEALERAAEALGELIVTPESRALLHVFHIAQEAKHLPAPATWHSIERAGVLGAGARGAEIAHLLASHGISVQLQDTMPEQIARARDYARLLFAEQAARGRLSDAEIPERMARITGKRGFGGFGTLDLVIDGGESGATSALAGIEAHVSQRCILATTDPLLAVSALQRTMQHPERVVGLNLLSLPRTRLAEVVPGPATAPEVVATAHALARRLGKTALVVADAPGFLLHRLLVPYLGEAVRLLEEGATVQQVDGALRAFGMGIEPLRLLDELGLDYFARLARYLAARLGERFQPPLLVERMLRAGRGGRAVGRGFYGYDGAKVNHVTETELLALIHEGRSSVQPAPEVPAEVMQERLLMVLTNEAARALADGVAAGPGAIDLAALRGLGYPALRGGPLWAADQEGLGHVRARLQRLAEQQGERFTPAPLLAARAEGGSLYPEAGAPNPSGQHEPGVLR